MSPGQTLRVKVAKVVPYGVGFERSILVLAPDLCLEPGQLPEDRFEVGAEHEVTVLLVSEDGRSVKGTLL